MCCLLGLRCSNHFRFAIIAIVQLSVCCKATVFKLCVRTEPGILLWNTVLLVVTTEISWFNKIRWIFVDTSGLGTGRTSSLLKLLLSPKIFWGTQSNLDLVWKRSVVKQKLKTAVVVYRQTLFLYCISY